MTQLTNLVKKYQVPDLWLLKNGVYKGVLKDSVDASACYFQESAVEW